MAEPDTGRMAARPNVISGSIEQVVDQSPDGAGEGTGRPAPPGPPWRMRGRQVGHEERDPPERDAGQCEPQGPHLANR